MTGEEAHIVARSPRGPRGAAAAGVAGLDAYDNLILLCAADHRLVDNQPAAYPPERLRETKERHEAWVRARLEQPGPLPLSGPHELPALPFRLVNRERELAAMTAVMERADGAPGPSVVVLTGMHGVGKSALGAHWVMRYWTRFPDGQLVADFSKRRRRATVDVGEVVGDFIRALAGGDVDMPPTLAERRRMFRRLTSTRKLLVLLDDVEHPAQVTNVLPAGRGSVVVVTSNHHLEELLYEGAELVVLDPLDDATALRLLEEMVGVSRLQAEPEAVDDLLRWCGGLPLALRVCGARLVGRGRERRVSWLVDRIARAADPLAVLSGSGSYAIQAIFDFAYSDLPPAGRTVYRRLGLHPGAAVEPAAAAVLANLPLEQAVREIERLEDAHLVETDDTERVHLHELVRYHIRSRLLRDDGETDREHAVRRLLDWYYAALRVADRAVFADRLRLSDADTTSAPGVPVLGSPREAFEWVDRERAAISGLIRAAADLELHDRVWKMAEALWPFCYNQKLYALWTEAYEAGVRAAAACGDRAAEARMRSGLARAYSDQGDFDAAAAEMRLARSAATGSGNNLLRASVEEFGAIMRFERGDIAGAHNAFRRSRAMFRKAGSRRGVAIQEYQIGKCLLAMGAADRALAPLARAYAVFTAVGDDVTAGRVLRRRGEALLALSHLDGARDALERALDIAGRLVLRVDQAEVHEVLAALADRERRTEAATAHRERASMIYREIGHPRAAVRFSDADAPGAG